jgi:hypothetical protein
MSTKPKKNAASAPPDAETPTPEYVTAQIRGKEINPEFLTLAIPDGSGGFTRARMRVPRRLAHCFKTNAVVQVRLTSDPHVVEPFPSIL